MTDAALEELPRSSRLDPVLMCVDSVAEKKQQEHS
jgi:hypothetical protein